jgi:tRNA wybutosine-synthesizing protein 2
MLLLPSDAVIVNSSLWQDLDWKPTNAEFDHLFVSMAQKLKITHIASTKPIPPRNRVASSSHVDHQNDVAIAPSTDPEPVQRASEGTGDGLAARDVDAENVLRSPHDFISLFGHFGPIPTARLADSPSREDFDAAFWAMARQNGIWQVWAPRWTMFSRGNITEKARLLELESVKRAIKEGQQGDHRGCAAVDLFTGIGYFAFSYVKAGVDVVLGWDLNPWSVEGLRRGAVKNKWCVKVCNETSIPLAKSGNVPEDERTASAGTALSSEDSARPRLLVFPENNEYAVGRVSALRPYLPPIRHVNCGMLPSSRASLAIAAAVLDPLLGGWVHVHENVAERDVADKAEETRQEFERAWIELQQERQLPAPPVILEHVYKLKNFAPRVVHIVIDLYVPPPST